MSNPTEQPINPDKMIIWCDSCKTEIIGFEDWEIHLTSKRHLSKMNDV